MNFHLGNLDSLEELGYALRRGYLTNSEGNHTQRISRAKLKVLFSRLRTVSQATVNLDCVECGADYTQYRVSKRKDGTIRVGCSVLSKSLVTKIRKWANGK